MTDWLEVAFVFTALIGLLALVLGGATAIGFGLMVLAGLDVQGRLVGSALLLIGGAVLLIIGGLGLD